MVLFHPLDGTIFRGIVYDSHCMWGRSTYNLREELLKEFLPVLIKYGYGYSHGWRR